jgi:hypothetical protein
MKTQKECQLEQEIKKLARDSKITKRQMPLESRLERIEASVTAIFDLLLKMLLVPR